MRRMAGAARLAAATMVIWMVLAALGALMTPPWHPERYSDHIAVETPDTTIAAADPSVGTGTPMGTYEVRESTVTIPLTDAVSVNAIVREPVGAPGERPALLMLQGAGTGRATEVYGDIAPQLASAGIVTMVPDKRLDDYTLFHRDYVSMAHDYEKELDLLRAMPGVDPKRTGVYAESEGTWISAVMTDERPDIAFSVIVSSPVYSGREQMTMAASTYFAQTGVPRAVAGDIPKFTMLDFSLVRLDYADFDALSRFGRLTQPALVVYGTLDPSMPIEQGAREIRDRAASGSGNRNVTLRYYPTNHQMRLGARVSRPNLTLDPSYVRDVASWINAAAAGTGADGWRTPMTAGAQPDQMFAVRTGAMTGGAMSPRSLTQLAALMVGGAAALALAGVPGAAWGLMRGARRAMTGARGTAGTRGTRGFGRGAAARLWALGTGTLVALLAAGVYLGLLVATSLQLESNEPLFHGGWVAMRVLSVLVALLWASALLRLWGDARRPYDDAATEAVHAAPVAHRAAVTRDGSRSRFARGVIPWTLTVLTLAGTGLVTVALAFFGLYSL
ncbi:hypothetical protein G1C96_0796 [Bifidobacterium sp. DSM 109958]|uniref:Alpha/beta hydrolase n=1 Tax=Bifidobacterium moraviense TaxID=2675323 RepID=A0A7Y0HZB0_9BIFI|nr:alpha/beta hydrolase [Bifidobacterium sp. DSM 109958]NMN00218.1 hypothetical protein [Bifidobacterium sp. DSM 109958]